MNASPAVRKTFAVAAPLALAIAELFHPHPHDLLHVDLQPWMAVHCTQLALFPLAGLAECALVAGLRGVAAAVCRAAMFVFAVSYIAFDTAAGIVTGVLVQAAQTSDAPDAWRPAIQAIWNHTVIGGSSDGTPALAVIGTLAWLVGTLGAAVACRRASRSWLAPAALVASAFGLLIFRTHAWPGGPVTFGALAVAAALM
ncbi:MAG TPA: hypothetical protein VH497_15810 [Vicinamibacterales bacterium]|jgi:hypothetical protein